MAIEIPRACIRITGSGPVEKTADGLVYTVRWRIAWWTFAWWAWTWGVVCARARMARDNGADPVGLFPFVLVGWLRLALAPVMWGR